MNRQEANACLEFFEKWRERRAELQKDPEAGDFNGGVIDLMERDFMENVVARFAKNLR